MAKPWRCRLRLHRWQRLRNPEDGWFRECRDCGTQKRRSRKSPVHGGAHVAGWESDHHESLGAAVLGEPGRRGRRPAQARSQLLGHDLHDRPGAAVLSGPAPLLEPTGDHDPAALGEGLGRMPGWSCHTTTVKNDASCSLRPDPATRTMARAIPPSVCRSSGSSVRLPAKLTLAWVMVCPFRLPGRAVCPALGPGETPRATSGRSPRSWPTRSRPASSGPPPSSNATECGHGDRSQGGTGRPNAATTSTMVPIR